MRRDLKIGMLIGVGVVICATVALSLWPGASVEDRVRQNMIEVGGSEFEPPKPIDAKPGNLVIPERKAGETDEPIIRPFVGDTKLRLTELRRQGPSQANQPNRPSPSRPRRFMWSLRTRRCRRSRSSITAPARRWQKILQANSAILKAPEKIKPGMRLVIPDATGRQRRGRKTQDDNESITVIMDLLY